MCGEPCSGRTLEMVAQFWNAANAVPTCDPSHFEDLPRRSFYIMSAKDRRASARLAFQFHQRICLLLLHSLLNIYVLYVEYV